MSTHQKQPQGALNRLPNISFRHLEALQVVHREGSYNNAANELHSTRTNVKRICYGLANEFKRPLIEEIGKGNTSLTPFAQTLLAESGPLARSIIHLGEGIRSIQRKGRVLRFATSNDFFHDGAFSIILSRIDVLDAFRPCYLRIEPDRYKAAILNSECDVYFGAGIATSNRLEIIHLDMIPWSFHPGKNYAVPLPEKPSDLIPGKWLIRPICDDGSAKSLLKELHQSGAKKGRILKPGTTLADDEILLNPEPSWMGLITSHLNWPKYLFSAVIKKQHPYSELINRLKKASTL